MIFESFTRYFQVVIEKATASEVARFADNLRGRARELQDMTLMNALPSPRVTLIPSDIVYALTEDKLNIVGVLTESDCQTGLAILNIRSFACYKKSVCL